MDRALTKKGTCGEDGNNERLAGGGQLEVLFLWVEDTEGVEPISHRSNTGDSARVVSKEDTTKGGETDHGNTDSIALWRRCTNAGTARSWTAWHRGCGWVED